MYTACPDCNLVTHFRIDGTEAEWIAKHAPETKPGAMPALRCQRCSNAGMPVPLASAAPSFPPNTARGPKIGVDR